MGKMGARVRIARGRFAGAVKYRGSLAAPDPLP